MGEKFIRTVRKSGGSISVNVPKEIVKVLKLKEGELVEITIKRK